LGPRPEEMLEEIPKWRKMDTDSRRFAGILNSNQA
jgi:hypothetical protein